MLRKVLTKPRDADCARVQNDKILPRKILAAEFAGNFTSPSKTRENKISKLRSNANLNLSAAAQISPEKKDITEPLRYFFSSSALIQSTAPSSFTGCSLPLAASSSLRAAKPHQPATGITKLNSPAPLVLTTCVTCASLGAL